MRMMPINRKSASPSVCLIGRRVADNENLGLGYLEAALVSKGIGTDVLYLNTPEDLSKIASHVVRTNPLLVGLSLADGGSSILPLAQGDLLRRNGFLGHITSGGQFATLARDWLLERYAWLDSVVRHAGEVPIVRLFEALLEQAPLSNVPGLTTRGGEGAPASVLDRTPIETLPERGELPRILGFRAAHIQAGRGCLGRCGYCSPAALQIGERNEGRRAGISNAVLKQHGVGGVRRRSVEAVCGEMADLYHNRDVRYFYFVDEHMLPYEEAEALQYIDAFDRGLKSRGVEKFGIGTMLRADRLTPKIVESFAHAGLVRAFIGLEIGDENDARRFGRKPVGEAELDIVKRLNELKVATVSNMMPVHPYSSEQGIKNSLRLLASVPAGIFEISRMMIYHGTKLFDQIHGEGRLTGNPIRYGYRMATDEMERFSALATRLRIEAFHNYSAAYTAHDAALHAALGLRVYGNGFGDRSWTRISSVSASLRAIYIDAYTSALELAMKNASVFEATRLVADVIHRLSPLNEQLQDIQRTLFDNCETPMHHFNPFRAAAAASMLTFVLAGSSGCKNVSPDDSSTTDSAVAGTDSSLDTFSDSDEATTDSWVDTSLGSDETETDSALDCTQVGNTEIAAEVSPVIGLQVPCFIGSIDKLVNPDSWTATYRAPIFGGQRLNLCSNIPQSDVTAPLEEQALSAVESLEIPCEDRLSYFGVEGVDALNQYQTMTDSIINHCDASWRGFVIELDSSGMVADVYPDTANDPADETTIACIKEALVGLSFSCLADLSLCPEMIIIE